MKFVAELSANHLGSFDRAFRLVDHAAKAGADAFKVQCWSPGTMVGNKSLSPADGPWKGRTLSKLYEEAFTPWAMIEQINIRCGAYGMEMFASVFDLEALKFMESLGVKRHKIASFELVDLELIDAAASTGKPLIMSTGMAAWHEIDAAVSAARGALDSSALTLLRCVSAYPAPSVDASLGAMSRLWGAFRCDVGLSDHSKGNAVSIAAAALGADMIERHLTLSRADGGPDAGFSLEPHEFAAMVDGCRSAEAAVSRDLIGCAQSEVPQIALRRSLWWHADLALGEPVARQHILSARPADGLPCGALARLLGSRTTRAVKAGEPITESDFS